MEDILAVYSRPFDKNRPVVCMDEKPFQLLSHTANPLPMDPCKPYREDYEYRKNGTCSIFIFTEPLADWRYADASLQRTKKIGRIVYDGF